MRAIAFAFSEATGSLWRGRQSATLSMVTIAVAMFVFGGFLGVVANLGRLGAEWGSTAGMSVYLNDDLTADQQAAINGMLAPGALIAARTYVSKRDAAARFKQTFGDLAASLDSIGDNPLPASYDVSLRSGAGADPAADSLAASLRRTPGVADVRYDRDWLNRLASAGATVRAVGLVLAGLMAIGAALTVAAVVRLALFSRRDEIEIMQLVGAPAVYVRGPFIMEGILQGGIGAGVALAALAVLFTAIRTAYLAPLASAIHLSSIQFLPVEFCVLLIVGGMAVGCVGGLVAAWGR